MERSITNETPLSFITVGEFKRLVEQIVQIQIESVVLSIDFDSKNSNNLPETFGKKECSELTGYSINSINKMISEKAIPYYKKRAKVIFKRDEIMEWLLENKVSTISSDYSAYEERFLKIRKGK